MGEKNDQFDGQVIRRERDHSSGRTEELFSIYYNDGAIVNISSLGTVYGQIDGDSKSLTNCQLHRNNILPDLRHMAQQGTDVTLDEVRSIITRAEASCLSEKSRH
jgi:hypothetical protein